MEDISGGAATFLPQNSTAGRASDTNLTNPPRAPWSTGRGARLHGKSARQGDDGSRVAPRMSMTDNTDPTLLSCSPSSMIYRPRQRRIQAPRAVCSAKRAGDTRPEPGPRTLLCTGQSGTGIFEPGGLDLYT